MVIEYSRNHISFSSHMGENIEFHLSSREGAGHSRAEENIDAEHHLRVNKFKPGLKTKSVWKLLSLLLILV